MEINRKLINPLSFITTNGVCTLFQLVVLFILVVVQFFLWIVSGSLISIFLGNSPYVMDVAAITSWATVFVLYALVWFRRFYNWFKEEFKWFYWNITFATTPLVFALIMFNPHI